MKIERREFLKLFGGAAGTMIIGGFGLNQILEVPDQLIERVRTGNGIETWKNTVCRQCSGGCGIRVRMIDDVPVFIKGNPIYPVNQGGVCPMGRAALQQLYNPDRLKTPLRRIGIPGSGRWEPVSWEDAMGQLTDELRRIRTEGRSHEVAYLGFDETPLMREHASRFMWAYGSPNCEHSYSASNDGAAFLLQMGSSRIPAYDFQNARLVVSFGGNYLEEGYAPVYFTKLYGSLRDSANGTRTRFIQVEPRMSLTAANADRWVPIRPGTYGALALGLAHVLIREEMFDSEFVRLHTFGFDDWTRPDGSLQIGFETLVLKDYYPERVSELTGVPADSILEIARELGLTRPSVVLGNQGVLDNVNGTYAQMCVNSLNTLLGNLESDGGVVQIDDPPVGRLPDFVQDETARAGTSRPRLAEPIDGNYPFSDFSIDAFTENILADRPYSASVLLINGGNPLFQALNHHRLSQAMREIPLVVSFTSFINETHEFADIILPTTTFLEAWDEISTVPGVAFSHVGIQQPVVEPFYETRSVADILNDLGSRLGDPISGTFSSTRFEEQIKQRASGLYRSGLGAVAAESIRSTWLEFLRQRGWQSGRYESFDQFWRLLVDRGAWWNPVRSEKNWEDLFHTSTGRFEFFSITMRDRIRELVEPGFSNEFLRSRLNISVQDGEEYLPHHQSIEYEDEDQFPLYLTTFQTLVNRDGHSANQPLMQEMFGYQVRRPWMSWVELNPETADHFGVSEGEWVWVESPVNSVRVQAKIHPGIMPDVVAIPFGLGHTAYGRFADGHGINPNSIMKDRYDRLSGKPALQATRVTIGKIV